jgi:hypothetical protein
MLELGKRKLGAHLMQRIKADANRIMRAFACSGPSGQTESVRAFDWTHYRQQ